MPPLPISEKRTARVEGEKEGSPYESFLFPLAAEREGEGVGAKEMTSRGEEN